MFGSVCPCKHPGLGGCRDGTRVAKWDLDKGAIPGFGNIESPGIADDSPLSSCYPRAIKACGLGRRVNLVAFVTAPSPCQYRRMPLCHPSCLVKLPLMLVFPRILRFPKLPSCRLACHASMGVGRCGRV